MCECTDCQCRVEAIVKESRILKIATNDAVKSFLAWLKKSSLEGYHKRICVQMANTMEYGTYDSKKALKAFSNLVAQLAKSYDGPYYMTRSLEIELCKTLRDTFEEDFKKGVYKKHINVKKS